MAEQPVNPTILKDMVLMVGADDFAAAVSSATITPTTSVVTWKGLKPDATFSFSTAPTYVLDLEYAQDEVDTSLSTYLWNHQGETIEGVVLEPASGVGARYTFNLMIAHGAVGGAVDTVGVASVSLGINGRPVRSAITTP